MNASNDVGLYTVQPIGRIHTIYRTLDDCPKNSRFCTETCSVEIFPAFAEALGHIESASHLIVMYWLDRADRSILSRPATLDGIVRGAFATRSPMRPNPIGLSIVPLFERKGHVLSTGGFDCLDGTPLVDIKPYLCSNDCFPSAVVAWNKS
ncbi:MAG: tRNA (N6-threonylcarbamoyladenosine(37)-N6)-methyltransferase TrmO [Acidihalobacter sp.]|uniref:tRNA (N6-threonylcarbamoyladenosine(37)-N6)-methyltransferase TrmO n=1 Tax=Acidihalobacter sp. TaxID=1872108 RepID=UPI00307D182A